MTILTECRPVVRRTPDTLSHRYGPDRGRPLVVTLASSQFGTMIHVRPLGTRRSEVVPVEDVYRWAIAARVRNENLEKARARKARKAAR